MLHRRLAALLLAAAPLAALGQQLGERRRHVAPEHRRVAYRQLDPIPATEIVSNFSDSRVAKDQFAAPPCEVIAVKVPELSPEVVPVYVTWNFAD